MKISKAQIRELTDSKSWDKGVKYHEQGNVVSIFEGDNAVTAKVSGTRDYRVKLWLEDGELGSSCTCPMGEAGVFCKHCVAAGLTYLEDAGGSSARKSSKSKSKEPKQSVTLEDIHRYLSSQTMEVLVEMILDRLDDDDTLRERLMMRVALVSQNGPNMAAMKTAITQATRTGGFVDYQSAFGFYRRVDNAVDAIEELLKGGFAKEAMELSEHALKRVEKALGEMDDSDGYMSGVIERLEELHHSACAEAKLEPVELAKRLFEWELTTNWDTFSGAVETYADVLGKEGIAAYRKLAEAEWEKVPALEPSQRISAYDHRRFRITSIMKSLAAVSGDVEELVVVKSKDLSSPYHYLEIARTYKESGDSEKALEWAEMGVSTFANNPDDRLNEFLADEYHRRSRHAEAMKLIWQNFLARPHLNSYETLKQHADRCNQWPTWRQQALDYIRSGISEAKRKVPSDGRFPLTRLGTGRIRGSDHSTLVEIFLWEKDLDAAWKEAKDGGCSDSLWMQLAHLRERNHPAESIPIYQTQVLPLLNRTNNASYREAVVLIKKICELMKTLRQQKEFQQYLSSIRTEFARKRNFIKMLDRLKMT